MRYFFFLLLSTCVVISVIGVPKILFGPTKGGVAEDLPREKELEDFSEEELLKELSELVENLTEEQLASLEEILDKEDLDDSSEFRMITDELKKIGMDDEDIQDLKMLTKLMHDFLISVPKISENLKLTKETDLQDHVQLYLLGLPNNLGPLGYVALHKVLEDEDDEEEGIPVAAVETLSAPTTFRRRRHATAEDSKAPSYLAGSPSYNAQTNKVSKASHAPNGAPPSSTAPATVASYSGGSRFKYKVPLHSHKGGGY